MSSESARLGAIYYSLAGPAGAPVVLLLHGLGSCADDWAPQIAALAPRYRVLAVDLPGHHRSARPRGAPSVARMAADVEALLDRLAIPRAHVVGLSLGGCVALALTLHAPTRVRSFGSRNVCSARSAYSLVYFEPRRNSINAAAYSGENSG